MYLVLDKTFTSCTRLVNSNLKFPPCDILIISLLGSQLNVSTETFLYEIILEGFIPSLGAAHNKPRFHTAVFYIIRAMLSTFLFTIHFLRLSLSASIQLILICTYRVFNKFAEYEVQ